MKKVILQIIIGLFFAPISFAQNPESDSIPLHINTHNTIYVQAILNQTDTLLLNFDTGTTELILTNNTLQNKIKSNITLYNSAYTLKIGNTYYNTKVYDAKLTGHGTDGRFGWDLFKDKVVELNYDKNLMVIHPKTPAVVVNDQTYTKLPFTILDNVFLVKSTLTQGKAKITGDFLFDTGYQRTVMIDNEVLKKTRFPVNEMKELKRVVMRGAQGNEIPVITLNLERFTIAEHELIDVPVQLLTSNRPIKKHAIHYIGNEVLKRFNCFFDFPKKRIYLTPNSLFNQEYIEKK
ncbi:clan AA aspartic protease [Aquimarina sp. TRL1]|uniref:clan AA aspartic protease n=1 Tax=Aquimarina sp. (strain TRL1) TaxID=2736252 RepID=UPI00158CD208|nr:clan AA aspartic protease [Aquimarina sp. TRL1]QKX05233.1 clan AA aspartic protease [Aquimarina sp. TRL1]